jgi:nicotinate dehydrogenase subunit B
MSTLPANLKTNPLLSRWVAIGDDQRVTIKTGKVEIGQGAVTAIAAIAAAELGLRIDQLVVVSGDTDHTPDEGYTAGSFSIEHGGGAMRWACALVRMLFAAKASDALGGDPATIRVENGIFSLKGRNEGLSYWQMRDRVVLDGIDASTLPMPRMNGGSVDGGDLLRLDLDRKLSGAGFIQDMALPGMLYGRVLRPDHPGKQLVGFDRAAVAACPGVRAVVVDGHFAGVVAARDEQALKAVELARKTAEWRLVTPLPPMGEANGWMAQLTPRSSPTIPPEPATASPTERHGATFSRPYIAHASIGPSCAVADWSGDRLQVWSHSQGVYPLRAQLARALRVPADRVSVTHVHGAGCYGHNGADDVALDAALLARAAGAPVMVLWTRADELSWSPFGAAMRIEIEAGLTADRRITGWRHQVWSPPHIARPNFGDGVNLRAAWEIAEPHAPAPPNDVPRPMGGGDRNAVPLYRFDGREITYHLLPQGPLHSSALRSLGSHGNVFAIECFMDEMAEKAGIDPLQFRFDHLDDERAIGVLGAVAGLSGWDPNEVGGEGFGRGIAWSRYKNHGGYCAVVARVEVTEKVRLLKIFAAVDCGEVIHRDGILNQIEGGIVQAASWTLKEQAGWTEQGFAARGWSDYPILSFSETPEIEIVLVEPEGAPALGAGECAAGPVAAAIGNAVAHALGVRVRQMPLTPERIAATINSL